MSIPAAFNSATLQSLANLLTEPPSGGPRRPLLRAAARLIFLGVMVYGTALLVIWWRQEKLLFYPVQLDPSYPLTREADVHERVVNVEGAQLSVLEMRLPNPKGVVFYLHGNGGNLANWFTNTALYRTAGFDLVMLDYRGYGKSTGTIKNEAQLHADAQAVWEQVAPRYKGRHVVFFGRSLGTGLAAALAAKVQPDLTVLVSPYTSMVALASQYYPWVPAFLLRYQLRTDQHLGRIHRPVLLLHGDLDALIPHSHSQALVALNPTARLAVVQGGGHDDLQQFNTYKQAVLTALHAL